MPRYSDDVQRWQSPPALTIRRALVADAMALTAIAVSAKRFWGYPERWIAQWQSELTVTPAYIGRHDVFVGEVDGRAVGFYALERQDAGWRLEHLWVDPPHARRGVGRQLFEHAVRRAHRVVPAPIEIIADPFAESFYRKMGARRVGELDAAMDGEPRVLPVFRYEVSAG